MTLALDTPRLHLSQVQIEDWVEYYSILSAPETSAHTDLPRAPTEKRAKGLVGWMIRTSQQAKGFAWMVRLVETDVLIGCIRLNSIDKSASVAVIGYEFGKSWWGHGYATESLIAVTKHCHEGMKLFRLEAWTLPGNPASDRVLIKAGFRYEGTQRQKMIIGSQRFDQRLFGRLADD
ncbi:GNAT family N-acetyltransferase [Stappia sp. BW2]|uniref:GNAT family N-acetyltransferase n=1 Tax=Stappia sp. BW2 TaxID=2592622 RepID=UPI0011DEC515|nr:GNAT family protein [Stappia sp. BW2]TYC68280.1 GNAT family N-acetyltransferase [Stappia sp. BW2]